MNMKTIGVLALAGILGLGLLAGAAVAASPALWESSSGAAGHGIMGHSAGMMAGSGTHGTCAMDQTRTMSQTCSMIQTRAMDQTCAPDQVRAVSQTCLATGAQAGPGPISSGAGQTSLIPGYVDCPYYPCNDCTAQ